MFNKDKSKKNNDKQNENKQNPKPKQQTNINNKQSNIQPTEQNTAQQNMISKIQKAKEDLNQIIQGDSKTIAEREDLFYKTNQKTHKRELFENIKLLKTALLNQLIFTQNMINGEKQLQKQSFLLNIWQKIITFFEVLKNVLCYYFNQNQQQLPFSQDKSNDNNQHSAISELNNQDYIKYIQKMFDQQINVKDKFLQLIKQFSFFTKEVCNKIISQQSELILKQIEIKKLYEEIKHLNKDNQNLQQQVEQLKQQNGQQLNKSNDSKAVIQNQINDSKLNEPKSMQKNVKKNLNINSKINSIQIKLKTAKKQQQEDDVSTNRSEISKIAMLLSKSDTGKKFIMKTLFPQLKQTKFYKKYYQKELDLTIVDTACFEFDEIDERERQIQQFKKIFSDQRNQYQGIWIVVEFERSDIMKKNVMEIYKFVKGLELPISMIVTNIHLSENLNEDQNHIISKFEMFKFKQIVFFGNQTQQEEMKNQLESTFYEYQRIKSEPINTKDTIFEDDDPEFEKQLLKNLAETMLRV